MDGKQDVKPCGLFRTEEEREAFLKVKAEREKRMAADPEYKARWEAQKKKILSMLPDDNWESKRVNVDFCEEKLCIWKVDIPKYQAKVQELREMALRAGYTKDRAEAEYYLTILDEE